ncbi:MAG TPA: amidohydrolase family protein [Ignavibacteria bacterium]|nr:amidohydrolase family protein [Ignavibacteria bacterium]
MILKNLYIAGKDNNKYDIRINNDIISEIYPSGNPCPPNNDPAIDLNGFISFPGLINSHDHLEFNLYPRLGHKIYNDYVEWGNDIHVKDKEIIESIESIPVELRMRYGVIKNLLCGVTAVAHHGSYNSALNDSPVTVIKKGTCIHSVKLGGKWKINLNLPLSREPYVIHIGEGINQESKEEIEELIRWNLFGRKLTGIHAIAMTEQQSKNFSALIWCPDSNLFLFNRTADITSLKKFTKILFGTDSTLTSGWNIFNNLRTARKLNMLSDEELFNSVTKAPAEYWKLNKSGVISEGYKADIVISEKNSGSIYDSFYNTDPEGILLILKSGKFILYDQSMEDSLSVHKIQNNFQPIALNGKLKFINYNITGTLNSLGKYNLSLPVGMEAM